MKKENNTNTRSFDTSNNANLKKLLYSFFCDDAIPLHNFEFRKTIVPLLTKDFSSKVFTAGSFFMKG